MFARVISVQIQPGKTEEAATLYRNSIILWESAPKAEWRRAIKPWLRQRDPARCYAFRQAGRADLQAPAVPPI